MISITLYILLHQKVILSIFQVYTTPLHRCRRIIHKGKKPTSVLGQSFPVELFNLWVWFPTHLSWIFIAWSVSFHTAHCIYVASGYKKITMETLLMLSYKMYYFLYKNYIFTSNSIFYYIFLKISVIYNCTTK